MDPIMILKWLQVGQMAFPAVMNVVTHYAQMKDDPNLSETDKQKMIENLEALKLRDWDEITG